MSLSHSTPKSVDNPILTSGVSPTEVFEFLHADTDNALKVLVQANLEASDQASLIAKLQAIQAKLPDDCEGKDRFAEQLEGSIAFSRLQQLFLSDRFSAEDQIEINGILSRNAVVRYFCAVYDLPEDIGVQKLKFHRAGTTSNIFLCNSSAFGQCALKLIKVVHMMNDRIRKATKGYEKLYQQDSTYAPEVYKSSETWVLMEFIDGQTLEEFVESIHNSTSPNFFSHVNEALTIVFGSVISALEHYANLPIPVYHGDLNPQNIIIQPTINNSFKVKIIDFGPNYVIQEQLSSARQFAGVYARTKLFISPEVLSDPRNLTKKADLYSVGMMLLEIADARPLAEDRVGVQLQRLWTSQSTSGFAAIIEDLIEKDPEKRALLFGLEGVLYTGLKARLAEQARIFEQVYDSGLKKIKQWPYLLVSSPIDVFRSALETFRTAKRSRADARAEFRSLSVWSAVNVVSFTFVVVSFWFLTLVDAQIAFLLPEDYIVPAFLISFFQDYVPHRFIFGEFFTNLWGRLVAVSFGIIAARYYANILSTMHYQGLPSGFGRWANFSMRINALYYAFPISVALIYDPKLWPYCSFVGTIFPSINNWILYKVSSTAYERARRTFSSEELYDTPAYLNISREWAFVWMTYMVIILFFGICLLDFHLVQGALLWALNSFGLVEIGQALLSYSGPEDEWVYALFIVIINFVKVNRVNCGNAVPMIYGGWCRLFHADERYSRYAFKT